MKSAPLLLVMVIIASSTAPCFTSFDASTKDSSFDLYKNINQDSFNQLPLMLNHPVPKHNNVLWAIATNQKDLVKNYVATIKNINKPKASGINPLQLACRNGFYDLVAYLVLEVGADVNYQVDKWSRTALMWACSRADLHPEAAYTIIRFLFRHGADWSQTEKSSDSTAFSFIEPVDNQLSILKLFFENAHVPIDYQATDDQSTILHQASSKGSIELIKYVLMKGANPKAKNKQGKTPHNCAQLCLHKELIPLIQALLKTYPYFFGNFRTLAKTSQKPWGDITVIFND